MDEVTDFLTCKEEEPSENENNDESEAAHDIITKEELLPEDDRLDPSCNLNEIKLENDNWEERMCEMTSVVITEANHIKFEIEGENVKDVSSKTPKARHRPGPRSRKRKLSESSENDGIMSSLSGITRRSSRRTVTTSRPLGGHLPQTFRDTEVSLPDNLLYCDDCASVYDGDCPEHGPLNIIEDVEVPIDLSDQSRASRTGPPLVRIGDSNIPGAGCGVRAAETIPARTRFGPYEGVIIPIDECTSYSWLIRKDGLPDHCLDGTEPGLSNWMRFVNCSRQESERNLVAFQYLGKVYYRTSCQIEPNEELLVWCGREYGRQLGIPSEAATVNSVKDTIFKCSACPFTCVHLYYMERHKKSCQGLQKNSDISFNCFNCSFTCTNPSYLERHKKLCKGGEKVSSTGPTEEIVIKLEDEEEELVEDHNTYACTQCYEVFYDEETLSSHQLTHAGENPLICKVCNERFFDLDTLTSHIQIHYGDEKGLELSKVLLKEGNGRGGGGGSSQSGVGYTLSKGHLPKEPAKAVEVDERFPCPLCGIQFFLKDSLTIHLRIHRGEKPFLCLECDVGFAREDYLRRHSRVHHEGRPFVCAECNKGFTELVYLKQHQRKHKVGTEE